MPFPSAESPLDRQLSLMFLYVSVLALTSTRVGVLRLCAQISDLETGFSGPSEATMLGHEEQHPGSTRPLVVGV